MVRRRTLLAASTVLLATPAILRRASAQPAFNWQQCKGQTITVSLTKNPRADNLQAHEKEFEALTGIKVLSEQMPEQQQRPKMVMELASGQPSFDVTHFSLHVSKRVVGEGHWLVDLRALPGQPETDRAGLRLGRHERRRAARRHPAGWACRQPAGGDRHLAGLLQQADLRGPET